MAEDTHHIPLGPQLHNLRKAQVRTSQIDRLGAIERRVDAYDACNLHFIMHGQDRILASYGART